MKRSTKFFVWMVVWLALGGSSSAWAQHETVLPFMDNVPQAVMVNPVATPEYKFTIGTSAYVGYSNHSFALNDFLRARGDSFLFDPGHMISKLDGPLYIQNRVQADLLTMRMRWRANWFTLNFSSNATSQLALSQDLLKLFWYGNGPFFDAGTPIRLDGSAARISAFNEIGLGYSRSIKGGKWNVGGRIRLLSGVTNLNLNEASGSITTDVNNAYAISLASNYKVQTAGIINQNDPNYSPVGAYFDFKNSGVGVDLGATYKPTLKSYITASVRNLGYINWNQDVKTYEGSLQPTVFSGVRIADAVTERQLTKVERYADSVAERLNAKETKGGSYRTNLGATYTLMGGYNIGVHSRLSLGIIADYFIKLRPSYTLNYYQRFGRGLNFSLSYTYMNQAFNNIGFGFMIKGGPVQWHILTDNLMSYGRPLNARNLSLRTGINFVFGTSRVADSDNDGVPDHMDKCPKEPGVRMFKGCPDTDLDGIPDSQDKCINVPGVPEFNGCPDTDNDGIADSDDKCPQQAGPKETQGCPDTDGDGVVDPEDKCPTIKGLPILKGCPDTDGDGIGDGEDKCPTDKGPAEHFGCPDTDGDGIFDDIDSCRTVKGVAELKGCPYPDADRDGVPDKDDACPNEAGLASNQGCPLDDFDKDGVIDKEDKCPQVAGPISNQGCPLEIKADIDKDGVADSEDRCPTEPGLPENAGCPLGDQDGDGVLDEEDRCPTVKGEVNNFGCPNVDTDGDGLFDKDDKCPKLAGPKENQGCPDTDTDGDGVLDRLDDCPQTKGPASNKGCPVLKAEEKAVLKSAFSNLEFQSGKDVIIAKSFPALDKLVGLMKKYPAANLRLQGHTDNTGSEKANMVLSRNRVLAIQKYLAKKGIAPERVETEWYGSKKPKASNATPAGRKANRRVEMELRFQ